MFAMETLLVLGDNRLICEFRVGVCLVPLSMWVSMIGPGVGALHLPES